MSNQPQQRVPVLAPDGAPLTPCREARARQMVKEGKATPFLNRGIFCVRLQEEPSGRETPNVACGIDPGSKMEGFSVVSEEGTTYLNIQAKAKTGVKLKMKRRREARRRRRYRKCPYRKPKFNNKKRDKGNWLPPSTKARWDWKLRVCKWLSSIYPIKTFVVEDVKAKTKKRQKYWNLCFIPLMRGKHWFYENLSELGSIEKVQGYETFLLRAEYDLKKTSKKTDVRWDAHCVDAWVIAANELRITEVDQKNLMYIEPFNFRKRQLQVFTYSKGGGRRKNGGTRSLGFTRGSLVFHTNLKWNSYELCYVGGAWKASGNWRIALHDIHTGKRLTLSAKPKDCKFKTYLQWKFNEII